MRLLDLYKVETLDSRFASKTGESLPNTPQSRWKTPEYYFYYACFLTIPFFMFKSVYDISQPEHPGYSKFEGLLEDGWIPGRKVDNSDAQYSGFRDNVPYMAVVLILHPLLRRLYERWTSGGGGQQPEKVCAIDRLLGTQTYPRTRQMVRQRTHGYSDESPTISLLRSSSSPRCMVFQR